VAELARKTIKVLRGVAAHPSGVGLSELARLTGIPKATCLRILGVLEEERVVVLQPDAKRYSVSIGVLAFAARLLDPGSGYLHFQAELEDLAGRVEETCGFDILSDREVMVVMQVQGPRLISQAHAAVPRLLPTWRTSTGKVLMAHVPEDELEQRLADAAEVADPDALRRELAEVRELGYACALEELEPYLAAVAAPVHVRDSVVGAVWIGGPTFRLTRERIPGLAEEVQASAGRLSQLGGDAAGLLGGNASDSAAGDGRPRP
jgi:IclR family transcriptional regulator, acetate operon repressor